MITSALFAGAAAGLIAALLQLVFVQPVLLHAELYESGQLIHFGADSVSAHPELGGLDLMRDGLSVVFSMLLYTGYALILLPLMSFAEQRGQSLDGRNGLIWGAIGFLVIQFAAGFSLAPEVPGVAAADVGARQLWWFGTVASAGIAAALIAFTRSWATWVGAAVLLLAPHLIGAPEPDTFAGTVPPEIAALFAARAFGVALVGWSLLGAFAAYFWRTSGVTVSAPQPSKA
ncbi:CbtA family protein [Notoacmeibacter sp. MSK16QG-6]|uniref:CbtA family protein n=1 Tax=Notoacmeibacter sp. MSK16QG-6 TaxID=2957982 RepID=UPI00209F8C9E|nr:CbtA family protein [Notoacmeibacter sp. MSK16QG-6]MCP1198184.1 CbtA family protein [Notoacmeibacter sp. MSK16QG-6]